MPLIKDKFGDYSDMSNYRGITLSSFLQDFGIDHQRVM